jgi:NAD(P)-dependent dehydrogenase (short-subunit alcohol dehydrogenase family)
MTASETETRRPVGLVTGASRGLGEVIARELAGEGFDVVLTARDGRALTRVAETLGRWGGSVRALPGDVRDAAHRDRLRREIDALGGLELLVNNAATLGRTPLPPLLDTSEEELEQVWRVNVVAPLALLRALRPALAARHGLVVNLSSDAAVGGYAGWGNYGATKAALDLASRTLAHELGPDGIAVVSVDPGDMRTPGAAPAFPADEFQRRPAPEVTLPFWAWLLGQPHAAVTGRRFLAQSEHWGAGP